MTSNTNGENTLKAISTPKVVSLSNIGLHLLVNDKEYFLPYKEYPWFDNANRRDIFAVFLETEGHLRWPNLDVDLEIDCLEHPEKYPLIYR